LANQEKGLIFDIQGHSVHDGPGTRTLIFLSGCPLRCAWCANPEGMLIRQRLMFKPQYCKECPRRCVEACPQGAVKPLDQANPLVELDMDKCDQCETRECMKACYTNTLQLSGQWRTVDEVMKILQRDRNYWGSKGGLSLSGGEPLGQIEFVAKLLKRCNESYISVCVETSGCIPRKNIEAVMPYVQWFFIDVKNMDSERHKAGTGVGNELILSNIEWIAQSGWKGRLFLRMPVIPGFNDSAENALATAKFMNKCGLKEINLLPFHRLGASKHEQLGMDYAFGDRQAMKPDELKPLAAIYAEQGVQCYLGSDTPF
jgi:pyruvate formate lyase activating enzyme